MKFRNDLGRIVARQRERAIGGEHTALHEKFAEGIVWCDRCDQDQLALRPVQHVAQRSTKNG